MSYIKVTNGAKTASATIRNVQPAKPYLKIGGGYLPLSTGTINDRYIKINKGNTTYRILNNKTVTKTTWDSYLDTTSKQIGLNQTTSGYNNGTFTSGVYLICDTKGTATLTSYLEMYHRMGETSERSFGRNGLIVEDQQSIFKVGQSSGERRYSVSYRNEGTRVTEKSTESGCSWGIPEDVWVIRTATGVLTYDAYGSTNTTSSTRIREYGEYYTYYDSTYDHFHPLIMSNLHYDNEYGWQYNYLYENIGTTVQYSTFYGQIGSSRSSISISRTSTYTSPYQIGTLTASDWKTSSAPVFGVKTKYSDSFTSSMTFKVRRTTTTGTSPYATMSYLQNDTVSKKTTIYYSMVTTSRQCVAWEQYGSGKTSYTWRCGTQTAYPGVTERRYESFGYTGYVSAVLGSKGWYTSVDIPDDLELNYQLMPYLIEGVRTLYSSRTYSTTEAA